MSGTIDGISYASSSYVYDTNEPQVVTQILYFDQSGTQVADQQVYFVNPILINGSTTNADGTFSLKLEEPGANDGFAKSYWVDTFSSAGVWLREDNFSPNFIDPNQPGQGITGYSETGYMLINAQSSGTINGAFYDMVESHYSAAGFLTETDYLYDLNGKSTVVDKVVNAGPNPVVTAPFSTTATAGAAQALTGISVADAWAANHAGSMALNISVSAGTVTGVDASGQAFTVTPSASAHLSGSLANLNSDLSQLSFSGPAGDAKITFQVYDQAGASTTQTEVITVSGTGPGPSPTPDPALSGITQASVATGATLALNGVTFSDSWAAGHAGTLALNINTNLGTLADTSAGVTGSGTSALHAVGTVTQIQADLAALTLTSSQAGTANVNFTVYDQAGAIATDLVGVTVHAA